MPPRGGGAAAPSGAGGWWSSSELQEPPMTDEVGPRMFGGGGLSTRTWRSSSAPQQLCLRRLLVADPHGPWRRWIWIPRRRRRQRTATARVQRVKAADPVEAPLHGRRAVQRVKAADPVEAPLHGRRPRRAMTHCDAGEISPVEKILDADLDLTAPACCWLSCCRC